MSISKIDFINQHRACRALQLRADLSTAAATFLMVGALIVIVSASLCFTLPHVNVMRQIVLPGLFPGSLALLAGIPFAVYAFLRGKEHDQKREALINQITSHLNSLSEADRGPFIEDNLLPKEALTPYKNGILTALLKKYEKPKAKPPAPPPPDPYESLRKLLEAKQRSLFGKKPKPSHTQAT